MQKRNSTIFIKFIWQFAIVMGLALSVYSQPTYASKIDHRIIAFQNENSDLEIHQFLAEENSHIPFHNSPAEESSSNEENGEEENEETNDSDNDGELSHYQVESLLNPLANSKASADIAISSSSYNIPLYILFHCWKSFIS
ncbi:hypothetical protein QYS49_21220 [Marivirga salinae]|uniref:Uncharacterized protein n=1 Tax=Marivirga salinarum TaxID=3059078 RepID=A0AA49GBH2_9BACT|nr:hypothetical protein [Marivirga sp. BDSF4-3]WKK74276.2 hypothetical protein QYS49_21220 [Marivirga sp. BDSF4-3]